MAREYIHVCYCDAGFDDGHRRQRGNVKKLVDNNNGKLKLDLQTITRPKACLKEKGAEELLLKNRFPYDAVIINYLSDHVDEFLECAEIALECNKLPLSKIIYICPTESCMGSFAGKSYTPFLAKDSGRLTDKNAQEIINILYTMIKR